MAFSGTFIARGSARGIVVATGEKTEIGKIAQLMKETPRAVAAPLMRKIAEFTKFLVIIVLSLAALNLLLGVVIGGYDLIYSFLASVSLAVAGNPRRIASHSYHCSSSGRQDYGSYECTHKEVAGCGDPRLGYRYLLR